MTPWLSRPAAQHAMRLALALLACLLAAWVEWQRPVLPTRLDVRGSTGPPPHP